MAHRRRDIFIDFLKSNDIGKAAFYVAQKHLSYKKSFLHWIENFFFRRKIKSLERENGFIAWSKDLIQTEDKWKIFFERYLNKTVIVPIHGNKDLRIGTLKSLMKLSGITERDL